MPRPKIKTRLQHLADAHERLLRAQESLAQIDLRTTAGDLRASVRASREQTAGALAAVEGAIREDHPTSTKPQARPTTPIKPPARLTRRT